jgi:hypothetical protein
MSSAALSNFIRFFGRHLAAALFFMFQDSETDGKKIK